MEVCRIPCHGNSINSAKFRGITHGMHGYGVNDPTEIHITPLKSKNEFEGPYLRLKRTSSKTIL
jgi:hypothetical protein